MRWTTRTGFDIACLRRAQLEPRLEMPCPHCKAEVGPADVYCISCGARQVPLHQAETVLENKPAPVPDALPPAPLEAESSVQRRAPRWLVALVAVAINLALLVASAWLVYAALVRYAERNHPSMSLGAPRLVRVAPQPVPVDAKAGTAAQPALAPSAVKSGQVPGKPPPTTVAGKKAVAASPAPVGHGPAPATRPAPRRPAASNDTSDAEQVGAGLDADSVRMVVQHHSPQVRVCYDRALKQQDTLSGVVEIQFEVSSEGKVRNASVYRNTTGHEGLGKCIATTLKGWRFPRPVGGDVVFIYPFLFSSGE